MWVLDFLKSIFAAYQARKAAKAAAELSAGAAAATSIDTDGATIDAQLRAARSVAN